MGKYDNYDNAERIKKARAEVEKLRRKRKPDMYSIDIAEKRLKEELLFESCQIFGRGSQIGHSKRDPNDRILFSDDNEVMMFGDKLIKYQDLMYYQFVKYSSEYPGTATKRRGGTLRMLLVCLIFVIVFCMILASVALLGIMTIPLIVICAIIVRILINRSREREELPGFLLQVFLKNGEKYELYLKPAFFSDNRISKSWHTLGTKLDIIIETYKNKENKE